VKKNFHVYLMNRYLEKIFLIGYAHIGKPVLIDSGMMQKVRRIFPKLA